MRRFECIGLVCLVTGLLAACGGSSSSPAAGGASTGMAVYSGESGGARSTAYDGANFLVGLQTLQTNTGVGSGTSTPVGAILVDGTGAPVGSPLILASVGDSPSVACDSANHCLMAWADHSGLATDGAIIGQMLSTAGGALAASGSPFTIQAAQADVPNPGDTDKYLLEPQGIVFDGVNFLVVYTHVFQPAPNTGPSTSNVLGQFVSTAGTLVGTALTLSATPKTGDVTGQPAVAYDSFNAKALVTWTDATRNTKLDGTYCSSPPASQNMQYSPTDIEGQFVTQSTVGAAGTLSGANFAIQQDATRKIRGGPSIAFDGSDYFIVWTNETAPGACDTSGPADGPSELIANFMDTVGNLFSTTPFLVGSSATRGALPQVAYDPTAGGRFVVVWTDLRNDANGNLACDAGEGTCMDVWGQTFVFDSTPGVEARLVSDAGNQFEAALGAGGGKLLLLWDHGVLPNGSGSLTSPNVERDLVITAP